MISDKTKAPLKKIHIHSIIKFYTIQHDQNIKLKKNTKLISPVTPLKYLICHYCIMGHFDFNIVTFRYTFDTMVTECNDLVNGLLLTKKIKCCKIVIKMMAFTLKQ